MSTTRSGSSGGVETAVELPQRVGDGGPARCAGWTWRPPSRATAARCTARPRCSPPWAARWRICTTAAAASAWASATWHAAARARTVLLRHPDGSLDRFTRGDDEPVREFATRIASWGLTDEGEAGAGGHAAPRDAASAALQFLMRGDLPSPKDASVYALHPALLEPHHPRLIRRRVMARLWEVDSTAENIGVHGAGVEPAQPERAVYSRLVSPMTRPMLGVNRGIRTRHFRDHNPACCLYTMNTMTSLFRDVRRPGRSRTCHARCVRTPLYR